MMTSANYSFTLGLKYRGRGLLLELLRMTCDGNHATDKIEVSGPTGVLAEPRASWAGL